MTFSLSKNLKIDLIFSIDVTPQNLTSNSFLYRFGILCYLPTVCFHFEKVFSKNFWSFYMSKYVKNVANWCLKKLLTKLVLIRKFTNHVSNTVFKDRTATNQDVGFFKAIWHIYLFAIEITVTSLVSFDMLLYNLNPLWTNYGMLRHWSGLLHYLVPRAFFTKVLSTRLCFVYDLWNRLYD